MSYISNRVHLYNESQKKYTVAWLEKALTDYFVNSIKRSIELAIDQGESHCGEYFYSDTEYRIDAIYNRPLKVNAEQYLKDPAPYLFVDSLAYFLDSKDYSAAQKLEHQIDLTNIENTVQREIMALGAKSVSFYVRYYEYFKVLVYKDSFWRGTYQTPRKQKVCKYKVCYFVNW